jgi:hypothetical protein
MDEKLDNLDIGKFLKTWTQKCGHPLITIKLVNCTHIFVSQEKFFIIRPNNKDDSKY